MEEYNTSAWRASKIITTTFSTSFSSASTLFSAHIRQDIYNIYALVRIADEIVDSYQGEHAEQLLGELEIQTYQAIDRLFSSNVVVHAFALTAKKFGITKQLIAPFFASMRTDLTAKTFTKKAYQQYIFGSAEVVGLMCLKVFCKGDELQYSQLAPGAQSLGSAFQKVNFLRDIADDFYARGRYYFPVGSFDSFDEQTKKQIISDIKNDFTKAEVALIKLPSSSIKATKAAFVYYKLLLKQIESTPADLLKKRRVRVHNLRKLWLLTRVKLGTI